MGAGASLTQDDLVNRLNAGDLEDYHQQAIELLKARELFAVPPADKNRQSALRYVRLFDETTAKLEAKKTGKKDKLQKQQSKYRAKMLGAFPPLHPLDLSVDTLLSHKILERSQVTDEGDRFELIGVAKQVLAIAQLHEAARKIQGTAKNKAAKKDAQAQIEEQKLVRRIGAKVALEIPEAIQEKIAGDEFITFCDEVFNEADEDGNRTLVGEELVAAINKVKTSMMLPGEPIDLEHAQVSLKEFDRDHSKSLDQIEFCFFSKMMIIANIIREPPLTVAKYLLAAEKSEAKSTRFADPETQEEQEEEPVIPQLPTNPIALPWKSSQKLSLPRDTRL